MTVSESSGEGTAETVFIHKTLLCACLHSAFPENSLRSLSCYCLWLAVFLTKHRGRRAGMIRAHKTADINKPIPHCCQPQTERKQKTWHILCRNAGVSKAQDASAQWLCGWGWGGLEGEGGGVRRGQAVVHLSKQTDCIYIFVHSSNTALGTGRL